MYLNDLITNIFYNDFVIHQCEYFVHEIIFSRPIVFEDNLNVTHGSYLLGSKYFLLVQPKEIISSGNLSKEEA